jgi:glycosyltransferase involved in cell wall biosynthesis
MTLAIVANSLNAPSETFIRAHVRDIAPGRTVVLCDDGSGAETLAVPVLSEIRRTYAPRHFVDRLTHLLNLVLGPFLDPSIRGVGERRIRSFLQLHGVTVVLAEFGQNGSRLRLACKRAQIPLYVHFHGLDATRLARKSRWRRHYRKLFRDATGVIVPSSFLADRLRKLGCPEEKLYVSPHGIDPKNFEKSTRERGRLISIGRLVEKKAPHLTIRAFAAVRRQRPDCTLDIVGDGPLHAMCVDEIKRLGLGESVRLHGAQSPEYVRSLLKHAALFVQHSVTANDGDMESFGVSLIESMASSVPVVATDHNGFSETVIHGETGYLVAEHDVEGMAAAILALLDDPDQATRMGRAGRVRVEEHFTNERAAARLREIMVLS